MTTIQRREFLTMVGIGPTEVAVASTDRAAEAVADSNQPPGEQNTTKTRFSPAASLCLVRKVRAYTPATW